MRSLQAIVAHVALGDSEGIRRDVAGVDRRVGKRQGGQDGEATRARAEVQNRAHRAGIEPQMPLAGGCLHLPAQQLADIGARHDDPLVDVERMAPDPGLVRQIGRGLARGDAPFDDLAHGGPLGRQQPRIEPGVELIDRQMQRVQDEIGGLVEGIGGAVAVHEPGRVEAAYGIAQPVPDGDELVEVSRGMFRAQPSPVTDRRHRVADLQFAFDRGRLRMFTPPFARYRSAGGSCCGSFARLQTMAGYHARGACEYRDARHSKPCRQACEAPDPRVPIVCRIAMRRIIRAANGILLRSRQICPTAIGDPAIDRAQKLDRTARNALIDIAANRCIAQAVLQYVGGSYAGERAMPIIGGLQNFLDAGLQFQGIFAIPPY